MAGNQNTAKINTSFFFFHKSHNVCMIRFGMKYKQPFQFYKCILYSQTITNNTTATLTYEMQNEFPSQAICPPTLLSLRTVMSAHFLQNLVWLGPFCSLILAWSHEPRSKITSRAAHLLIPFPIALTRHSHAVGVCLMNEWGGVQSEVLKHPRQVSDQSAN